MSKLAVIILLLLLGTNAFSMPLTLIESDIYAVEIEPQSFADTDATQTENAPSAETEERQEESAILTYLNQYPLEICALHFSNYIDKALIGALPDIMIPPNI